MRVPFSKRLAVKGSVAMAALAIVSACTQAPVPALDPAGPLSVRVDTTVQFEATGLPGALLWSVDGDFNGSLLKGQITDGEYQAPVRVPTDPTVTVSAAVATDPSKSASAEVTITAPGTLYVLSDDAVYVFNDMDVASGDVTPNRSFKLSGAAADAYYDMAMAPEIDTAFIGVNEYPAGIYRVTSISTASGTVPATAFSAVGYQYPAGLAYDHLRDILYVQVEGALLAYDDASTAPAGHAPARVVSGPSLDTLFDDDSRINLDAASNRLFISNPDGVVSVYDGASTISGHIVPDRNITVDYVSLFFLWGAAYDSTRDELYLADQKSGVNIYVIEGASTADGLVAPDRIIGGPGNVLSAPSQISYDPVNDRLVAVDTDEDDVKVYDAASTLEGDVAPSRIIGGASLPISYSYGGYLDPTQ